MKLNRLKQGVVVFLALLFTLLGLHTAMAANNTAAYQQLRTYIINNGTYKNNVYVKSFTFEGEKYNFFYGGGYVELRAGQYNRSICLDDEGTSCVEGDYSIDGLDLNPSVIGIRYTTNIWGYYPEASAVFVASDGSSVSSSLNTTLTNYLRADLIALEKLMTTYVGSNCNWASLGYTNLSSLNEGTTMNTAVNIVFDKSYSKTWTTKNNHLNHYCKITVPSRGLVTINASKPYDSEGEYGRMEFTLYSDDGTPIWGNDTYYSKDIASDSYKLNVGLNAGVYYLTIKPSFRVVSGNISTRYSIGFNANMYYEVEPNESVAQGTMIQLGSLYTGFYGKDGSDYGRNDYWRMQLNANTTYKISVGNFSAINNTTTLIYVYDPNGTRTSIKNNLSSAADSNGMNYVLYTPKTSGVCSICFDNYSKSQYKYTILVKQQDKQTQWISGVATSITKNMRDSSFLLNASAQTKLRYSSSNTSVATVLSNGRVYIWGEGTTVINITAEETDIYKSASLNVVLTIIQDSTASPVAKDSTASPVATDSTASPVATMTPVVARHSEEERITIPRTPASVKAKAKKNKVTVSWKKIKKNKAGKKLLSQIQSIQIQVSTDPAFSSIVTDKRVGKNKTKVTLNLQKKTAYYIRIRYVGADGVSSWKTKRVRTK